MIFVFDLHILHIKSFGLNIVAIEKMNRSKHSFHLFLQDREVDILSVTLYLIDFHFLFKLIGGNHVYLVFSFTVPPPSD